MGSRVKILIDMKLLALFSVIVGLLINGHQLFFELVKNGHPKLPSSGKLMMRSIRNIFHLFVRPSVYVRVCAFVYMYVHMCKNFRIDVKNKQILDNIAKVLA